MFKLSRPRFHPCRGLVVFERGSLIDAERPFGSYWVQIQPKINFLFAQRFVTVFIHHFTTVTFSTPDLFFKKEMLRAVKGFIPPMT
jgi:hypothetical protein